MAGQFAPAVGGYLAFAGIEAHDDVTAKGGAGVLQKARVLDRSRANDDVAQARIQVTLNGVQVANATAELHVDFTAHFLEDLANGGLVFGVAGKGPVQVHQMQAPRTFADPTSGHHGRVLTKGGGLVHIALFEAYAVAVF